MIEIDEIVTEFIVTEPNGSLSREEMKNIVQTVLEHIHAEQDRARQRKRDTGVRDRAYQPEGSDES